MLTFRWQILRNNFVVKVLKYYVCALSLIYIILVQVITQFLKLETLLDDSVDQKIVLEIERGGTQLTVDLMVRIWVYMIEL